MHGLIQVNLVSEKMGEIDHKSEYISGSVNIIDSGAIFLTRLAEELYRNASVVSILFPEGVFYGGIDFCMHPKIEIFHEFSTFLEICQDVARKLLGCFGRSLGHT